MKCSCWCLLTSTDEFTPLGIYIIFITVAINSKKIISLVEKHSNIFLFQMRPRVPCVVPNCDDLKSSRHRFPNPNKDRARFDAWLDLIGNPRLRTITPDKIYEGYRVCGQHFTKDDIKSNNRLNSNVLPSQNLFEGIIFFTCCTM